MALVRKIVSDTDVLSTETLARMTALENRPVDTSDIPESTPEELREIRRQLREKRKKYMYSLRLEKDTIEWWQSLGAGYTRIMAYLLAEAKNHPEWIKECLQKYE